MFGGPAQFGGARPPEEDSSIFCQFMASGHCTAVVGSPFEKRTNERTVVLDESGFSDTVKVDFIASKLVDHFSSGSVLSLQSMPGRAIRIIFNDEPLAAGLIRESSVFIDNVVCTVKAGCRE